MDGGRGKKEEEEKMGKVLSEGLVYDILIADKELKVEAFCEAFITPFWYFKHRKPPHTFFFLFLFSPIFPSLLNKEG